MSITKGELAGLLTDLDWAKCAVVSAVLAKERAEVGLKWAESEYAKAVAALGKAALSD